MNYILLDYDNLLEKDRKNGLRQISQQILNQFTPLNVASSKNICFRLYGGWYSKGRITEIAQDLQTEIESNFPKPEVITTNGPHKVVVQFELAMSLLINPRKHYLYTYRKRSFPSKLKCIDPIAIGCKDDQCSMSKMFDLFNNKLCDNQECNLTLDDVLIVNEQKLVDSMIISDMLFLGKTPKSTITIVSSDDDIIPGIDSLVIMGSVVNHFLYQDKVTQSIKSILPTSGYNKFYL